MSKIYIGLFSLLEAATFFIGVTLKDTYDYAMLIAAILATVFLLLESYIISKKKKESR